MGQIVLTTDDADVKGLKRFRDGQLILPDHVEPSASHGGRSALADRFVEQDKLSVFGYRVSGLVFLLGF